MFKMYFLCCAYRKRIKDQGIIKLRIAGLYKQISDLRSKGRRRNVVKPTIPSLLNFYLSNSLNNTLSA